MRWSKHRLSWSNILKTFIPILCCISLREIFKISRSHASTFQEPQRGELHMPPLYWAFLSSWIRWVPENLTFPNLQFMDLTELCVNRAWGTTPSNTALLGNGHTYFSWNKTRDLMCWESSSIIQICCHTHGRLFLGFTYNACWNLCICIWFLLQIWQDSWVKLIHLKDWYALLSWHGLFTATQKYLDQVGENLSACFLWGFYQSPGKALFWALFLPDLCSKVL